MLRTAPDSVKETQNECTIEIDSSMNIHRLQLWSKINIINRSNLRTNLSELEEECHEFFLVNIIVVEVIQDGCGNRLMKQLYNTIQ